MIIYTIIYYIVYNITVNTSNALKICSISRGLKIQDYTLS